MKSTTAATLVLALSTLVAGQAMAGSNIDTSNPSELDFAMNASTQVIASSKTRAEVRAELVQAKRLGANIDTSNPSELDFAFNAAGKQDAVSTLTRAQVRAEAAQATRSNIDTSNPSELDFAFNAASTQDVAIAKTRADVRAELSQAEVEPAPVAYAQAW
ncbi:MAG: DUF4148 domain-containing protein [Rhodoferax sp.]|nr:DUF4148 domain-containing protein [Rhodoferax sp.]